MSDTSNLLVPRFYMHTTENPAKSKKEGRPIFDEMEVCEVRMAANKQTVGVFPAHEVFKKISRNDGSYEELTYAIAFNEQYRKFKANEAQDMSGTPLSEAPFLSQGKRLELKALNVHTVEALAAVDGQPLKLLGMTGREMKNQAIAYLAKAGGSADVTRLAADNVALSEQMAEMRKQIEELTAAAKPAKAKAKPAAEEDEAEDAPPSPFEDWEDEDIRNWIISEGGEAPGNRAGHATLVKRADELNAEMAAKAAAKDAA
jgi:hypothetical protein